MSAVVSGASQAFSLYNNIKVLKQLIYSAHLLAGDRAPALLLIKENACLHSLAARQSFNDSIKQFLSVVDLAIVSRMYDVAQILLQCGAEFGEDLFNFPPPEPSTRDWHPLRRCLGKSAGRDKDTEHFINWYVTTKANPRSLKHLSRLKIRQCLGSPISPKLPKLPLPKALQGYVYLSDLMTSIDESQEGRKTNSDLAYYMPSMWVNHDPAIYAE